MSGEDIAYFRALYLHFFISEILLFVVV